MMTIEKIIIGAIDVKPLFPKEEEYILVNSCLKELRIKRGLIMMNLERMKTSSKLVEDIMNHDTIMNNDMISDILPEEISLLYKSYKDLYTKIIVCICKRLELIKKYN